MTTTLLSRKRLFLSLLIFCVFLQPFSLVADTSSIRDIDIREAYLKGDYESAARLLEGRIADIKKERQDNERGFSRQLYSTNILLAHIYAWRLNKYDAALAIYHDMISTDNTDRKSIFWNLYLNIYIAEIYEQKHETQETLEYLTAFLNESNRLQKIENDRELRMMLAELDSYIKYRIDSINLKIKKDNYEPLLKKLKLAHLSSPVFMMLQAVLGAGLMQVNPYQSSFSETGDIISALQKEPANFTSEMADYTLILTTYASSVDASADKAIDAYITKYPDTYYSLLLRAIFHKHYQESEQVQKADELLQEIKAITKKRGMELIIGPDERFASPELTWKLYKKALIAGDLELAMECHLPGERTYGELFSKLGKEKMRKIAEDMGPIEKIAKNETSAKYRIKRKIKDQDITFYITFVNMNGEWKINQY